MNIELRKDILTHSLELEDHLNRCLLILIDIKSEAPKTVGNKSSSIPLSSKVNLLYDLKLLNKEAYNQLFCFIEIRNQFMHNINCDTYSKAFETLSRPKVLLNLNESVTEMYQNPILEGNKEKYLKLMVDGLILKVKGICLDLHKESIQKLENKIHTSKLDKLNTINEEAVKTFRHLSQIQTEAVNEVLTTFSKQEKKEMQIDETLGEFLLNAINVISMRKVKERMPDLYNEVKNKKNGH